MPQLQQFLTLEGTWCPRKSPQRLQTFEIPGQDSSWLAGWSLPRQLVQLSQVQHPVAGLGQGKGDCRAQGTSDQASDWRALSREWGGVLLRTFSLMSELDPGYVGRPHMVQGVAGCHWGPARTGGVTGSALTSCLDQACRGQPSGWAELQMNLNP